MIFAEDKAALARAAFANPMNRNIFDYINEVKNPKVKQTMKRRVQEYNLKNQTIDQFELVDQKYHLAVFSSEFHAECQAQIPSLAKLLLAAKNNNIIVKVINYDDNRDVAEELQVLRVPTIIVYDKNWRELGRFIERPERYATIEEELWGIIENSRKI